MRFLMEDVRNAARSLSRAPAFAFWVILLLAMTLGANALLFTIVDRVVLRPLPFAEPERLVWVWSTRTDRDHAFFSLPDYVDFREQNRTVENFSVFTLWGGNTTGPGGPERWPGIRSTANTFELLGVLPERGRLMQSKDGQASSPNVMVITHGLWQRRFGGREDAIGQAVTLSGTTFSVIGVLPRNFLFPGTGTDVEFVVPLIPETDPLGKDRNTSFLRGFARLKPGVTLQQAYEDFAAINQRLKETYPDLNAKKTAPRFFPLQEELLGTFRPALLSLLTAVGLVLLLAVMNLANLLQVRCLAREKEFAVRMALGASPRQLGRMLLTESLLVAFAAGAVAIAIAWLGLASLLKLAPPDLPRIREIEFGWVPAAFTFGMALLAGFGMSATPAMRAEKSLDRGALTAEARGGSAGRTQRGGLETLVLAEVAITTLLMIATGMFLKSYAQLQKVSPGFTAERVLMVRPALPASPYGEPGALRRFVETLQRELESIPGVESAGYVSAVPLSQSNNRMNFEIAGQPPASKEDVLTAQNRQASPGYFRAMQIPVLEGRDFLESDSADAQRVVIIDAALARQHFPGKSPLGEHLIIEKEANLIVGVVGEVKLFGLDDPPFTTLYQPLAQIGKVQASFAATRPNFVMRTRVEPLTLVAEVRKSLARVDGDLPVSSIRTMEQSIEVWMAPRRFNLQLLGAFALFAVVLTGLGTYVVLATAAQQRTREIGIRLALGATRSGIIRLILRRSVAISVTGVLLGMLAAGFSVEAVRTLLYQVQRFDSAIFLGVGGMILLVGMAASFLPAWRASRVDPIISLRG